MARDNFVSAFSDLQDIFKVNSTFKINNYTSKNFLVSFEEIKRQAIEASRKGKFFVVNIKPFEQPLLHFAITQEENDIAISSVSLLLHSGVDINDKDTNGNTPLVHLLLEAKDKKNKYKNLEDRVKFLVEHGADLDKPARKLLKEQKINVGKLETAKPLFEQNAKKKLSSYIDNSIDEVSVQGCHVEISLKENTKEFKASEFLQSDYCKKNGISAFSTLHNHIGGIHGFIIHDNHGKSKRCYKVTEGLHSMTVRTLYKGRVYKTVLNMQKDQKPEIIDGETNPKILAANKEAIFNGFTLLEIATDVRRAEISSETITPTLEHNISPSLPTVQADLNKFYIKDSKPAIHTLGRNNGPPLLHMRQTDLNEFYPKDPKPTIHTVGRNSGSPSLPIGQTDLNKNEFYIHNARNPSQLNSAGQDNISTASSDIFSNKVRLEEKIRLLTKDSAKLDKHAGKVLLSEGEIDDSSILDSESESSSKYRANETIIPAKNINLSKKMTSSHSINTEDRPITNRITPHLNGGQNEGRAHAATDFKTDSTTDRNIPSLGVKMMEQRISKRKITSNQDNDASKKRRDLEIHNRDSKKPRNDFDSTKSLDQNILNTVGNSFTNQSKKSDFLNDYDRHHSNRFSTDNNLPTSESKNEFILNWLNGVNNYNSNHKTDKPANDTATNEIGDSKNVCISSGYASSQDVSKSLEQALAQIEKNADELSALKIFKAREPYEQRINQLCKGLQSQKSKVDRSSNAVDTTTSSEHSENLSAFSNAQQKLSNHSIVADRFEQLNRQRNNTGNSRLSDTSSSGKGASLVKTEKSDKDDIITMAIHEQIEQFTKKNAEKPLPITKQTFLDKEMQRREQISSEEIGIGK